MQTLLSGEEWSAGGFATVYPSSITHGRGGVAPSLGEKIWRRGKSRNFSTAAWLGNQTSQSLILIRMLQNHLVPYRKLEVLLAPCGLPRHLDYPKLRLISESNKDFQYLVIYVLSRKINERWLERINRLQESPATWLPSFWTFLPQPNVSE